MQNYHPETYGDRIAEVYDRLYPTVDEACVRFLADLVGHGRALELGIGTGRVAIPLRKAGVDVAGVDASAAMVQRLRAKTLGASIPVTMGDFAELKVEGTFDLIYVTFNTFFTLITQEAQLACMKSVGRHLKVGGHFVMEVFVPDPTLFSHGQSVRATQVEVDRVQLDVSRHDAALQQVASQHVFITPKGVEMYPVVIRYAWPSELDMMASAAGMKLEQRWQDWGKTAFTGSSGGHISVYGKI